MSLKVSIIVPVYKTEKYLDRCANSLLNQTYKNIEIIFVDDGSPDSCPEICDKYAESDERIKVIHKKNAGLGFARNSGLDAASGDYVGFVDSDDYVKPNFVESLITAAENGSFDAVLGALSSERAGNIFRSRHIYAGNEFDRVGIAAILLPSILGADLTEHDYSGISACKGIYRRSLINKNGIRFVSEREYISEDAVFEIEFYRCAQSVKIINSSDYIYCYNSESLTHTYKADRFEQIKKLCRYELELVKKYGVESTCASRIMNSFLGNTRAALKIEAANCAATKKRADRLKFKAIINDEYLHGILNEYDFSRFPKKPRIYCYCIKYRLWRTALLLALIQNKTGK